MNKPPSLLSPIHSLIKYVKCAWDISEVGKTMEDPSVETRPLASSHPRPCPFTEISLVPFPTP